MEKFLLYLHRRIHIDEYGRKEMTRVLAKRVLKSIARSTGVRIGSNKWLKALEFLYRTSGSSRDHLMPSMQSFLDDFHREIESFRRTHQLSINRTKMVLAYLEHKRTNNQAAFFVIVNDLKTEFETRNDMIWFGEFCSKIRVRVADCGHMHLDRESAEFRGSHEDPNHTRWVCQACATEAVESGERIQDTRSNVYYLAEFAVMARTSSGELMLDRRHPDIRFNERYNCWHTNSWSPHANLITHYHTSKNIGFTIIDSPWFRQHRRAFGLELEVQSTSRSTPTNTLAGRIHDVLNPGGSVGEYCFFERDGSIGEGFEIITQPAGLDIHRQKMDLFLNNPELKQGLRSHEGGSCGLHIHVGKQYVTQAQIYRVQSFLNDVRNEGLIKKISRRYGNSYARIRPEMAKLSPYNKNTGERYEALNVSGTATIEFRIFRGSLRYESVMAALEFVDSLLNFCAPGQTAFKDFNAIGFRKYLMQIENQADAKYLCDYLSINANTDNESAVRAA
jgi:hypothetical protein